MAYYLKFNGKSSEGLFKIKKSPTKILANKKIETYNIPTLDGSYYKDYGTYEAYDLEIHCIMVGNFNLEKIQEVKEMFMDYDGKLEFSDEEGVYYKARLNNIIPFEEISQISGEFLLNFVVQPKSYIITGEEEIQVSNGDIINNIGNIESDPLIKITGTGGDVTLRVVNNDVTQEMQFKNLDKAIIIDCNLENCYGTNKENYNNYLSIYSDFIKLGVGENTIFIEPSGITATIIPRWQRL